MNLRTKLVIAFFALAVVPLASIVVYSYRTSNEAFRSAVELESRQMAEGMNQRMSMVREDLDSFLGRASRLALPKSGLTEDELKLLAEERKILEKKQANLAALVETCEFIPSTSAPPCPDEDVAPAPPIPDTVPPSVERFVIRFREQEEAEAEHRARILEHEEAIAEHHERLLEREHAEEAREIAWIETLIAEGTRMAVKAVEDPEAFEKELEERAPEIIGVVVSEGTEMVSRAIEDPEAFEQEMAEYGEQIRKHVLESIPPRLRLTEDELVELEARRARAEALLGHSYSYEIREGDTVLGTMRAEVSPSQVLEAVLTAARREEGEVPFAVDSDGTMYTLNSDDEDLLEDLEVARAGGEDPSLEPRDWIVVKTEDAVSGTTFGIARPLGDGLDAIRRTAARNMAIGLFVVAIAGWGVMPLTRRMTRNLSTLTEAANALARGELHTRVKIRSRDEIGQLATAFNRMANDLDENQHRLVEEERLRREQEVETRLLEVENDRKSDELEAARLFQLSLLPAALPSHPAYRIAVAMRTATEVGGDYYDFRESDEDGLTVALGDATGHGAAAGTMVTVAKSLFTSAKDLDPARFLKRASSVVRNMRLGRMTMALAVAHLDQDGLLASMAGMPPLLIHRHTTDTVEEVVIPGPPLGGFRDSAYRECRVPLAAGDTVLMMSDGFPELLDEDGEPLGYERARALFAAAAEREPEQIIKTLEERADAWRGQRAQADDMSFVVLRKV